MTQLNELKTELASLRVQKIAGGSASKLTKMWVVLFVVWVVMVLCQIWGMKKWMQTTGLCRNGYNAYCWRRVSTPIWKVIGTDGIADGRQSSLGDFRKDDGTSHHITHTRLSTSDESRADKQQHCPKVHCPSPYRHQPKAEAKPPRLLQEVQV
jgi:hypothetical protein